VAELTLTEQELDALAERVAARVGAARPPGALDHNAVVKVPMLLSVAATAKVLGVSPDTVRRRIAEGALPALREGDRVVVRADELRNYIDGLERIGQRPGRAPRARPQRRYDFLHGRSPS
jgi:excisionase family DNA binding protein